MEKASRIYVAGHLGLAGSALMRALTVAEYTNILVQTHAELDLCNGAATAAWFARHQPEYVFLAAARVGGIHANTSYPADFISDNLSVQQNVITAAWKNNVRRLLFLGSSCIYPRDCPQPIREDYLLSGPLEPSNRPYALAKIAGVEMCWAHNRQFGTRFMAVMPTNLYGPNDSYELSSCHVLPALIRKMHEAKISGHASVIIWGSGTPRREFLYSDDMATACVFLMCQPDDSLRWLFSEDHAPIVNIGCGEDLSIAELAQLTADVVGFKGGLLFDGSKPDGTPRKLLDVSRMQRLGWQASTPLRKGIAAAYQDYLTVVVDN